MACRIGAAPRRGCAGARRARRPASPARRCECGGSRVPHERAERAHACMTRARAKPPHDVDCEAIAAVGVPARLVNPIDKLPAVYVAHRDAVLGDGRRVARPIEAIERRWRRRRIALAEMDERRRPRARHLARSQRREPAVRVTRRLDHVSALEEELGTRRVSALAGIGSSFRAEVGMRGVSFHHRAARALCDLTRCQRENAIDRRGRRLVFTL